MTAWQYGQLTITQEIRGAEGQRLVTWDGPGEVIGEGRRPDGQSPVDLMNRAGAEGWELAGAIGTGPEGVPGQTAWEHTWSVTVYSFKREVTE
ncbi:MAG TPA: hypothetical protein VGI64_14270 [Streptosporangiaceae bacterium]|jgi:hypothetical protein